MLELRAMRSEPRQVECRERRLDPRDLVAEPRGPLGGGRLQRQRSESLAHLLLEIPGALDLDRDAGELQLGAMAAQLEPPEPGRLLDEGPPLAARASRRARSVSTEPCEITDAEAAAQAMTSGEQLDEIDPAHGRTIHEVLPLPAPVQSPGERDFAERQLRPRAVLVVEHELDLAEIGRLAAGSPGEEHVVGLLRPAAREG